MLVTEKALLCYNVRNVVIVSQQTNIEWGRGKIANRPNIFVQDCSSQTKWRPFTCGKIQEWLRLLLLMSRLSIPRIQVNKNKNKKRKPDQVLVNEQDESHVRYCVREKFNALLINSLREQPPHIGRGSECRLEPRITQLDILLLSYWIDTVWKKRRVICPFMARPDRSKNSRARTNYMYMWDPN